MSKTTFLVAIGLMTAALFGSPAHAAEQAGGWKKIDGLQASYDVAEARRRSKATKYSNVVLKKAKKIEALAIKQKVTENSRAKPNGNAVAMETITLQHEGLGNSTAAFNPKEISIDKSVPWKQSQPQGGARDGTSSTLMIGEVVPKPHN